MAVDVRTAPQLEFRVSRPLFQTRMNLDLGPFGPPGFCYAVSPDGSRFLVDSEGQAESTTRLNVALDWQTATRPLSGAGR
jgi:hypothetical protein